MSELAAAIRTGDRRALGRALSLLESTDAAHSAARWALIDAASAAPREGAQVIGLTGPPGVGKSTLAAALIAAWRAAGLRVGAIAVDPSSRRTGGALLGDRARMVSQHDDPDVFIRSMAARDRLGGLAPATEAAALVMRMTFDRVLIETVGVGQSETDVSQTADLTLVLVQPASGDVLQFIKAGLMEVFDLLAINKADLGEVAARAKRDLRVALGVLGRADTPVCLVSATTGDGVDALVATLDGLWTADASAWPARREGQLRDQAARAALRRWGTEGLTAHGGIKGARAALDALPIGTSPSALLAALAPKA